MVDEFSVDPIREAIAVRIVKLKRLTARRKGIGLGPTGFRSPRTDLATRHKIEYGQQRAIGFMRRIACLADRKRAVGRNRVVVQVGAEFTRNDLRPVDTEGKERAAECAREFPVVEDKYAI